MKPEDIYKDFYKAMLEDPACKHLLESAKDKDEKEKLEVAIKNLSNFFQKDFFDPLAERLKDDNFVEALNKKVEKFINNKEKDK